ncbi:hypothetical protein [Roseburia sp. 1XD42-34]|nr:hypothetical protein [Roseburia sp. 1XD42-34]
MMQEKLIIISLFEARELPIEDILTIQKGTKPDILRLHPSFMFLAEQKDYTTAFSTVVRLSFPGENIYVTPKHPEYWYLYWKSFVKQEQIEKEKVILPVWHLSNIKRLLWKGYYAIAVKGVAAYTGLLIMLIWFMHLGMSSS